jgi:hypothetical protein
LTPARGAGYIGRVQQVLNLGIALSLALLALGGLLLLRPARAN